MVELPCEILLKIFRHLNVFDLSRNVPNVNRQWRDAVGIMWKQIRRLKIYNWAGGTNSKLDAFTVKVKGKRHFKKRISSNSNAFDHLPFILKESACYLTTLHFTFVDGREVEKCLTQVNSPVELQHHNCSESFILTLINNSNNLSRLKRLYISGTEDKFLDRFMVSLIHVRPNLKKLYIYTSAQMNFDDRACRNAMEILSKNNPRIKTLQLNIFKYRDPPQWSAAIIEPLCHFQSLRKLKLCYFDFTDFGVQNAFRILVVRLKSFELEDAFGLDWLYSNSNTDVYVKLQCFAVRNHRFQSPKIMAQFVANKCPRLRRFEANFAKAQFRKFVSLLQSSIHSCSPQYEANFGGTLKISGHLKKCANIPRLCGVSQEHKGRKVIIARKCSRPVC